MTTNNKILIFVVLIFTFSSNLSAFTIQGTEMTVSAASYQVGQLTYLSLAAIAKAYGFRYKFDSFEQRATLDNDQDHIKLIRISDQILFNNREIKMEGLIEIKNGALYVPYSFLSILPKSEISSKVVRSPVIIQPVTKPVVAQPNKYLIRTIVIDPGHGGKDPGASYGKTKEKTIVFDVAQRLKTILDDAGIRVIMTRDKDEFISLWSRANIANKAKADLFVSVHANAARVRQAKGFEIYYLSEDMDDNQRASISAVNTKENATLWDMKHTENREQSIGLAKLLCDRMGCQLNTRNRGDKSARFYVLKRTDMPSVLIEVGFISNWHEKTNLSSSSYRQKVAETIAEGLIEYKSEYERTDGFSR